MNFVKKIIKISTVSLAIPVIILLLSARVSAAEYTFPVIGSSSFSNDYAAPRFNGQHKAIDIIAKKGQKIVSVKDGTVASVIFDDPPETQGHMLKILGKDGYCYWYLHMNNDNPGTDDGLSGPMGAFAADMEVGNPVKRGQLLGWVGDSGNSENTVPHLHFEVVKANNGSCNGTSGTRINPYTRLKSASRISRPINYPALQNEILPYGASYNRTVNVARGDVTGDGVEDVVTGADGIDSKPKVHVYNPNTKTRLGNFYSLSQNLTGGVDVAVGDINGDGENEVITGVRASQDAKIGVYRYNRDLPNRFEKVDEFVAYTGNNRLRVAAGDVDGDGNDEIITGTGPGVKGVLRVFDGNGNLLKSYKPVGSFQGGIDVSAGNIANSPESAEIALAPLSRGSSKVKLYDASSLEDGITFIDDFYAYGSSYEGGMRLSIGEVYGDNPGNEIATMPASRKRSVFRAINASGQVLAADTVFEDWWLGYYDIAASTAESSDYSVGTGSNRRGSLRP